MAPVEPTPRFSAPRPGRDLSVAFAAGLLLAAIVLGGLVLIAQLAR